RGLAQSLEFSPVEVEVDGEVEFLEVVGIELELDPLALALEATVGVRVVAFGTSVKVKDWSASPAVSAEDATSVFCEASTLDGVYEPEAVCSVSSASEVEASLVPASEPGLEYCCTGLSGVVSWLAPTSEAAVESCVTGVSADEPLEAYEEEPMGVDSGALVTMVHFSSATAKPLLLASSAAAVASRT
ncbi:hypothetical protein L916_03677, partial [Phytophthora nicotianae]